MLPVNIWYPALFIPTAPGYHPIMLRTNVFGFAGESGQCAGERSEATGRYRAVGVAATGSLVDSGEQC